MTRGWSARLGFVSVVNSAPHDGIKVCQLLDDPHGSSHHRQTCRPLKPSPWSLFGIVFLDAVIGALDGQVASQRQAEPRDNPLPSRESAGPWSKPPPHLPFQPTHLRASRSCGPPELPPSALAPRAVAALPRPACWQRRRSPLASNAALSAFPRIRVTVSEISIEVDHFLNYRRHSSHGTR
jgi:hypothetical protein